MSEKKKRRSQRYSALKDIKVLHTLACPYHIEEMEFIEGRKKKKNHRAGWGGGNLNKIITIQTVGLVSRNPTSGFRW